MTRVRIKQGECFLIPLPCGKYGYVQCVAWNDELGYLIRVFNKITTQPLRSVNELRPVREMFPPVFVGLRASVRSGRWKCIGELPVEDFEFPKFRVTHATTPGTYADWWVWDGEREWFVGHLPPELRTLEMKRVWGDELLEERIGLGTNPHAGIQ